MDDDTFYPGMTVGRLRQNIQGLPDDMAVTVYRDADGEALPVMGFSVLKVNGDDAPDYPSKPAARHLVIFPI